MVSGSETAFFSLTPAQLDKIGSRRSKSDVAILKLLSAQDYLLATVLIVNNLVNICIILLSNTIFDRLMVIHSSVWEFVIKTVVVTFLLLLFGEIMPKIFANYNPLRFATIVSRPLLNLKKVVRPLSFLLVKFGSTLNDHSSRKVNISFDELSDAIEITDTQNQEEKDMLSGIVQFVNTQVEDIMHARLDVVGLEIDEKFTHVMDVIRTSGFSRIPVYRDNLDNIEGVLYVKDMLPYVSEGEDFEWWKHLRKPYFVPEHKKINDLLEEFQMHKVHIAIVVDEYGSTLGLVSLEDILEEIVGEISDESDVEETLYQKLDNTHYMFEGKAHLGDFARVLDMNEELFDDLRGDAETVAGLMLELKRDFLRSGESVTAHGVKFTVAAIEGRRIDKVNVELVG